MHSIALTTLTRSPCQISDLGPTLSFERVPKTQGLIAPRPEERASSHQNSQPIRGGDEKRREINPFPFPLCVGTIIAQGKTCFRIVLANIPSTKTRSGMPVLARPLNYPILLSFLTLPKRRLWDWTSGRSQRTLTTLRLQ